MKVKYDRPAAAFLALLAALLAGCALASSAGANPIWQLNGNQLTGSEAVDANSSASSLSIPGMTATCAATIEMTIWNNVGTGRGEVTGLPLSGCSTNTTCTVAMEEAVALPWSLRLQDVGMKHYVVLEEAHFDLLLEGPTCVLDGIPMEIDGDAGAVYYNTTEDANFKAASFAATGTELEVFEESVEWLAAFPMETSGGLSLTVG